MVETEVALVTLHRALKQKNSLGPEGTLEDT